MSEDTKFPNEDSLADEHVYGEVWFYEASKTRDWFQRCIEDYYKGIYGDIYNEKTKWFEKWFGQFKEEPKVKERDPWIKLVTQHDIVYWGQEEAIERAKAKWEKSQ